MVTTECHSCIDCSLTYTSEQKNFDPTKTATQLLDSNSPLVHEGIEQCTLTLKPGKAAARGNFGVTGRGFAGMLHDTLHLGHADSPSECVDFVVFQNESKNWSLALTFRKGLIHLLDRDFTWTSPFLWSTQQSCKNMQFHWWPGGQFQKKKRKLVATFANADRIVWSPILDWDMHRNQQSNSLLHQTHAHSDFSSQSILPNHKPHNF